MKALSIQINGQRHCLAGLPNGGLAAYLSWSTDDGLYFLSVLGVDPITDVKAFWPAAELQVGDELSIRVVEADDVDHPEHSSATDTQ